MLGWRLLLGPVLIAVLVGIFFVDAQCGTFSPVLLAFAILVSARASWELVGLLTARNMSPQFWLIFLGSVAVILASWAPVTPTPPAAPILSRLTPLGLPMLALIVTAMGLFAWRAWRYERPGGNIETLGAELLCVMYLGGFLSVTAQLRWVRLDLGYLPLASVIVVPKIGDIMAYTAGRTFGKAKLAPLLSPGKTWAGAVGGLAGAMLGGWLLYVVLAPCWIPKEQHGNTPAALVFGFVVGLFGMIGDLCESLIKRDVGQKDSAPMLPGFGGLLDLLDSIVFAGPAAYILWLVWPPVGA